MTVAEMLVTVMIILILCGVGFIALSAYQRSMAQIQRDGYAKEIFIAAQNHLTMAKGEGYLGVSEAVDKEVIYGHEDPDADGVYYFAVNSSDWFHDGDSTQTTMLDLMLPFGSIDDIVRTTGRYVIRYQPSTATILDVFYCTAGGGRFDHDLLVDDDEYPVICSLIDEDDSTKHKAQRRTYNPDKYGDRSVLGWYGGADLEVLPYKIKTPVLRVFNGDTLYVEVVDEYPEKKGTGYISFRIILTGMESGAQMSVKLDDNKEYTARHMTYTEQGTVQGVTKGVTVYRFVLDDITGGETGGSNLHFLDLARNVPTPDGDNVEKKYFYMGEDIKVEAVAYSTGKLANVAYSEAETTNSLYESLSKELEDHSHIAYIGSIRHLENLEEKISRTGFTTNNNDDNDRKLTLSAAEQTRDLDWNSFFKDKKYVFDMSGGKHEGYYPVSYDGVFSYDGLRHSIENLKVISDADGYAGMFGQYGNINGGQQTARSEIKSLKLINFDVTGSGSTGALAGSTNATKIFNVVAYIDDEKFSDNQKETARRTPTVSSSGGTAGGLIGTMVGGAMRYSAAALVVQGSNTAGGLIGTAGSGAKITASYSGGHTKNGEYYYLNGNKKDPLYNVKASSNTGGLIGQTSAVTVRSSYSTCSAQATSDGGKAGGLIGKANSGTNVNNCYSTGLTDGGSYAFIGDGGDNATVSNCKYLEIINEIKDPDGVKYKKAVKSDNIVTAIDKDAESYQDFVGDDSGWKDAVPYDETLADYYNNKYNLKTVTKLTGKGTGTFVDKHYGDWPAPEMFLINE